MRLICSKSDLQNGVNIVSKAVPVKTSMTILECILIDASSDEIKLIANNTELGMETFIDGEIIDRGIIALDAKLFSEIVKELPDSEVVIHSDSTFKTNISCETKKYNIIGKSGEDFSYLPDIERKRPVSLSMHTLKDVINKTIFAVSGIGEKNPVLKGELIEIGGASLRIVGMDGHRIAIRNIELDDTYDNIRVIVPGKTMLEVSKVIDDDINENVDIYFSKNHVIFEFKRTIVISRLIQGEYFRVEKMLTHDYNTKFIINKNRLMDSINGANPLIRESDKKPIIMDVGEGMLNLKINTFAGLYKDEIDIRKDGNDIMIGFNPKFFIEALRVIDDEEISIYMVNPKAPCFIKDDDENYIHLILPINFNSQTV